MLERNYTSAVERADIDEGLRSYLVSVYNYMAGGLLITALAAFIVANTSMLGMMFDARGGMSGLGWLFFLAPLIVVFAFGHVVQRGTLSQVRAIIKTGKLNLATSIDTQRSRLSLGKELFPKLHVTD